MDKIHNDESAVANEIFKLFVNLSAWSKECFKNEDEGSLRALKARRRKFYILFCIDKNENCTLSELEKMLVENRSTASVAASKLYREGLISKNQPEKHDDGRKVYFKVTKKGRELLEIYKEDFKNDMQRFIKNIPDDKKLNLVSGIVSLNKVFE